MKKIVLLFILAGGLFSYCTKEYRHPNETNLGDTTAVYNLVEPTATLYEILKKDVGIDETRDHFYEKIYLVDSSIVKIEVYDDDNDLYDDPNYFAIKKYSYDDFGRIKFVKYYNKNNERAEDNFGKYWLIEYLYDSNGRIILELYRDKNFNLIKAPRTESGKIADKDFIAPALAYSYEDDNRLLIKAFDENFNLLKEEYGSRPCIPFIDCGK